MQVICSIHFISNEFLGEWIIVRGSYKCFCGSWLMLLRQKEYYCSYFCEVLK